MTVAESGSNGIIAAAVAIPVAAVIILAIVGYCCYKKRNNKKIGHSSVLINSDSLDNQPDSNRILGPGGVSGPGEGDDIGGEAGVF